MVCHAHFCLKVDPYYFLAGASESNKFLCSSANIRCDWVQFSASLRSWRALALFGTLYTLWRFSARMDVSAQYSSLSEQLRFLRAFAFFGTSSRALALYLAHLGTLYALWCYLAFFSSFKCFGAILHSWRAFALNIRRHLAQFSSAKSMRISAFLDTL